VSAFATLPLATAPRVVAPDGSTVRVLLGVAAGGMAQFELQAGAVSTAVVHRSVEEIWFVASGHGEIWRKQGDAEATTALAPGLCLTIPLGTRFQFRAAATAGLSIVAVTLPPWPGAGEARAVTGPWQPTVEG
jgi:mannose-6-phosphate isomerase-like protein (cupin superfamily)